MDPREIANRYYDAWINHRGDMSEVPLADDLVFLGPVASFDSAEGYRAMAREAAAVVTSFRVRHQFSDGDLICSLVGWTMAPVEETRSAAEVLEIRDGRIVRANASTTPRSYARRWRGPAQPPSRAPNSGANGRPSNDRH